MAESKDKSYFLEWLTDFFDPSRARERWELHSACTDVERCYQTLPLEERGAMEEAVLEWLNGEKWIEEAVTLSGNLRIREAVPRLLEIGGRYAPVEGDWKAESLTRGVMAALGDIGDRRAVPFLKAEASLCGEKELRRCGIAIQALSRIDLDEGLQFLPNVAKGDMKYRGQRALESEDTRQYGKIWYELYLLLSRYDKGIVPRLAWHLWNLGEEEKRFVLSAFQRALDTAYVFKRDARFTESEKEEMLREFKRGLGLAEDLEVIS